MSVTASEVLLTLFNPEEKVCLRVFDDRKTGSFSGAKLEVEAGKFSTVETTLRKHNSLNRGVFYVINYGGQEDSAIKRINAQFVEMDDKSIEEQQKRIDAFPLPPSMIIRTRKSLHTYWFIKNGSVAAFRPLQKRLIAYFGGDPACVNESRVLRLPGFNHCKQEPFPVECISFHPERLYTQEQLAAALPEAEEKKERPLCGSEPGLNRVLAGCSFLKHCRDDAKTLSEPEWFAMISNLALFEGGAKVIHEYSSPYKGYSRTETERKINSAVKSGARPVTCAVIADYGWRCPKMDSGQCLCRSPAALRFRPPSPEELTDMLHGETVTHDISKDIQTAKKFVSANLASADRITAETFIKYDIKSYFGLNASDARLLISLYLEEHGKTVESAEFLRSEKGADIPDWYEQSKSGLRFMPGVLAEHMRNSEHVFFSAEQYYRYQGGVYRTMSELEAQKMILEKMLTRDAKMSQIADAERQWRLLVQKDIRELNPNHYIINCGNGLYNVLEDRLTPHTADYVSTIQLNAFYNPEAKCPRFLSFLDDITGHDGEQIRLIQEMLGYFLLPVNAAQKCFVVVGAAGAGKSVLLRVLNEILLGRQNVSNVSWQALNERFKTAELFGKLANIFADLPTKNIDDNGIFKALVGEDFLTVEKKNKNPFSFQSTARLLFSCNSIPKNYGDRSEGFYRRLIIIRCANPVPVEKRDPELLSKLMEEADGILAFALAGLRRLMDNRYVFSESRANLEELQKYREDSDSVLAFVRECCVFGPDTETSSFDFYNAYKNYCEECGLKPFSQRTVTQTVMSLHPEIELSRDTTGKRRMLVGVKTQPQLH